MYTWSLQLLNQCVTIWHLFDAVDLMLDFNPLFRDLPVTVFACLAAAVAARLIDAKEKPSYFLSQVVPKVEQDEP